MRKMSQKANRVIPRVFRDTEGPFKDLHGTGHRNFLTVQQSEKIRNFLTERMSRWEEGDRTRRRNKDAGHWQRSPRPKCQYEPMRDPDLYEMSPITTIRERRVYVKIGQMLAATLMEMRDRDSNPFPFNIPCPMYSSLLFSVQAILMHAIPGVLSQWPLAQDVLRLRNRHGSPPSVFEWVRPVTWCSSKSLHIYGRLWRLQVKDSNIYPPVRALYITLLVQVHVALSHCASSDSRCYS